MKPIEEALATLPVTKMSSRAGADEGSVQIFFDWGETVDVASMKTAEKVDEVRSELPDDIEQIFINTFSTSQIPVVEARISAPGIDLSGNYDLHLQLSSCFNAPNPAHGVVVKTASYSSTTLIV